MYTLTLLFFASVTLALGICSPFGWFTTSAHARFLVPMAHLGCANLPLASIAAYFPTLKYLFLISPLIHLKNLHFEPEEIAYLRHLPVFKDVNPEFFDYLKTFRFTGDVWAIPEGTLVFK